jgi:hypothetical protein
LIHLPSEQMSQWWEMAATESDTLARLRALRAEVFDPQISGFTTSLSKYEPFEFDQQVLSGWMRPAKIRQASKAATVIFVASAVRRCCGHFYVRSQPSQ